MTILNNDFEFQKDAYEETVQRNDFGTSPEINKIKAQNNIEPRIALLLNGNPTFERMIPYFSTSYRKAWLNIKRACNSNPGKQNILGCGERLYSIVQSPQVQEIISNTSSLSSSSSSSSSSDPSINVGSLAPSTLAGGGGRKSIKRPGRRITRQKRESKSTFTKKRKAIKSSRKKRFVF
jgi:hypothetical protein